MRTGHCRHDWTHRSETLSAAFPVHVGQERAFRVCTRCLRVQELQPRAVAVEFPVPAGRPESPARSSDDRAA